MLYEVITGAQPLNGETIDGWFVGPRREMITPWSTNAVEITQNMGLTGIARIEEFFEVENDVITSYSIHYTKLYECPDSCITVYRVKVTH